MGEVFQAMVGFNEEGEHLKQRARKVHGIMGEKPVKRNWYQFTALKVQEWLRILISLILKQIFFKKKKFRKLL